MWVNKKDNKLNAYSLKFLTVWKALGGYQFLVEQICEAWKQNSSSLMAFFHSDTWAQYWATWRGEKFSCVRAFLALSELMTATLSLISFRPCQKKNNTWTLEQNFEEPCRCSFITERLHVSWCVVQQGFTALKVTERCIMLWSLLFTVAKFILRVDRSPAFMQEVAQWNCFLFIFEGDNPLFSSHFTLCRCYVRMELEDSCADEWNTKK